MPNGTVDEDLIETGPQTSPAEAFEDLRKELALCRLAVGGLVAAIEKLPDYGPVLINLQEVQEHNTAVVTDLGKRFDRNNEELAAFAQAPALQLTPDEFVQKISDASEYVRRHDHAAFETAINDLYKAMRQLAEWKEAARTADQQNTRLLLTVCGTFLVTTLLFVGILWLAGAFRANPPIHTRTAMAQEGPIASPIQLPTPSAPASLRHAWPVRNGFTHK